MPFSEMYERCINLQKRDWNVVPRYIEGPFEESSWEGRQIVGRVFWAEEVVRKSEGHMATGSVLRSLSAGVEVFVAGGQQAEMDARFAAHDIAF